MEYDKISFSSQFSAIPGAQFVFILKIFDSRARSRESSRRLLAWWSLRGFYLWPRPFPSRKTDFMRNSKTARWITWSCLEEKKLFSLHCVCLPEKIVTTIRAFGFPWQRRFPVWGFHRSTVQNVETSQAKRVEENKITTFTGLHCFPVGFCYLILFNAFSMFSWLTLTYAYLFSISLLIKKTHH